MSRAVIVAVCLCVVVVRPIAQADEQLVTWTDLVNVTVTGTVLQKTSGWDGVDDAAAISLQELTAGDGYVEFTIGEATTFLLAGLSHGNDGTGYADIDFAFRFNGAGWADVLENGVYAGGDTAYAAGDVFRVAVVGGRVQYSQNGRLLRESARTPEYPLLLDTSIGTVGATIHNAVLGVSPPPPPGGGLIETAGSPALRPRLTPQQIQAFLPPDGARGSFTFPAPYNTAGVRLTNQQDCADGQDCLWYAGYSYWRNINNHAGSADMYIFLGTDRNRGGAGPVLIRYNKVTDEVQPLGALFDQASPYSFSTGEGWYFSGTQPTTLYAFLSGSRCCSATTWCNGSSTPFQRWIYAPVRSRASARQAQRRSHSHIQATTTSCTSPRCRTPAGCAPAASSTRRRPGGSGISARRPATSLMSATSTSRAGGCCCTRAGSTVGAATGSSTCAAAGSLRWMT